VYFLHNNKERPVDAFQDYLPGSVFAHKAAGFPPPILYQNVQVAHTTSAAPFADVAYNLPTTKVDLGGRYTWQEKSGSAYLNSTGGVIRGSDLHAAQNASWTAFTPAATLTYQATGSLMSYATVSRGFLSGGFNANSSTDKGLAFLSTLNTSGIMRSAQSSMASTTVCARTSRLLSTNTRTCR